MRRILISIVLTLAAAAAASATTLEETLDRTFDVRPGALVSLANVNGHIKIQAWDQPRVRIHAEKRVRGSSDSAKEAMSELKIEIVPADGGLRVITRYPKRGDNVLDWIFGSAASASVDYDVTVPRTMDLDLENTNGTIEVSD